MSFTDEDYSEILAFRDQLRSFTRWSETQAKNVGLTPAQHQLLLAVRGHPSDKAPTIGEIAEHLKVRHHSAVGLIDRATTAGLVQRIPDAEDGRVVRVKLRPAGLRALEQLTAYHVTELKMLAETFAAMRLPEVD